MSTLAVGQPEAAALVVRSMPVDDPGPLLALLPSSEPLSWVRHGDGLVGWGVAARLEASGADRFADAERWWGTVAGRAHVRDEVRVPGSGPVAFGSFAFADDPGRSVLVVPQVVVGRRGDASWVTTIGAGSLPGAPSLPPAHEPAAPPRVTFTDGALSGAAWASAVGEAVARIERGPLEKVVLALDLLAEADGELDVRSPLTRLAASYPSCWTFCVDSLFGATPELLVRRERGLVTSRVLAGTIRRTGNDERDLALAASLARSSKDLEEHEYAVRSVAAALAPHCSSMNVPETPFVLHLANVMHLATDVTGVLGDRTSSLALAAALHPSAAVGGTPTGLAVAAIKELEQMDRDRYTGPVGWIDGDGDGEWGIALRCGVLDGRRVRIFAGCGIVAGSDPMAELAEAQAKLVPLRDALGG